VVKCAYTLIRQGWLRTSGLGAVAAIRFARAMARRLREGHERRGAIGTDSGSDTHGKAARYRGLHSKCGAPIRTRTGPAEGRPPSQRHGGESGNSMLPGKPKWRMSAPSTEFPRGREVSRGVDSGFLRSSSTKVPYFSIGNAAVLYARELKRAGECDGWAASSGARNK
jgi:hypothetical protein